MTAANDAYRAALAEAKKPLKHHNKPTRCEGYWFPSQKEANSWKSLRLLEKSKAISALQRQVRYPLEVNGQKVTTYVADFDYWENGVHVTEDAKGMLTQVFRIKAKLFKAVHGREIRIV